MLVESIRVLPVHSQLVHLHIAWLAELLVLGDLELAFLFVEVNEIVIAELLYHPFNASSCRKVNVLNHRFWHNVQSLVNG